MKNTTKKLNEQKLNEQKKISIDFLLKQSENSVLLQNSRGGAILYNHSLFEGLNDKEKKHARIKLRRKLENFMNSAFEYNVTKKIELLKQLKKEWTNYATQVYVDINNICDANASEQKRKDVKEFLQVINSIKD